MPQLDTIFIFSIFIWTWLMLFFTMKKTTTYLVTSKPKNDQHTTNKLTMTLPWT